MVQPLLLRLLTLGVLIAGQSATGTELPVRLIPNVPRNAEAYYAPDNLHVIAQTHDPAAQKAPGSQGRTCAPISRS